MSQDLTLARETVELTTTCHQSGYRPAHEPGKDERPIGDRQLEIQRWDAIGGAFLSGTASATLTGKPARGQNIARRKLIDDEKRKALEFVLKQERPKCPGAKTVNVKVSDTLTDRGELHYATSVTIETVTLLKAAATEATVTPMKSRYERDSKVPARRAAE